MVGSAAKDTRKASLAGASEVRGRPSRGTQRPVLPGRPGLRWDRVAMTGSGDWGSADDRMRAAAGWAQQILTQVDGEGILGHIKDGGWSAGPTAQQGTDIADLLESMAEAVRQTRALAGLVQSGSHPVEGPAGRSRPTCGLGCR